MFETCHSMTHYACDIFEVLLLAKLSGLARINNEGNLSTDIEITPLFETIDDLQRIENILNELLSNKLYFEMLRSISTQEIMVGYSDSCKMVVFYLHLIAFIKHKRNHSNIKAMAFHVEFFMVVW